MSDKIQDDPTPEPESRGPEQSTAEPAAKTRRTRAKSSPAAAAKVEPASKVKSSPRTRKTKNSARKQKADAAEAPVDLTKLIPEPTSEAIQVPAGGMTSEEALISPGPEAEPESAALMEAYRADTTSDAEHGLPELVPGHLDTIDYVAAPSANESTPPAPPVETLPDTPESTLTAESESSSAPASKLERLQKILSQAGVASRRHAEEMIVEGRVIVNGQVITTLGAKADPARDHIRVDGKLIHGPERHRTFVLNKPRGYVTTLDDPEGRPTVTQFFTKLQERLYPVGRLDYQSEGLLLMTNDGDLANRLTRAAAEVEKTYLVKVAGRPTEEELDRLRSGIPIERRASGSDKVVTAPAKIRQVRQGDNPWYEVILIEGRNRELRKMFQSIGHFVEKIRRVGYGPLVLDVEPGKFRELTAQELSALQLATEGKLKPRRLKASRTPPEQPSHPAERYDRKPPVRAGKSRPPRSGFGSRGGRSGPPRTDSSQQSDRSRPARTGFSPQSGRPEPPQPGSRPRDRRPYRDHARPRQENQQRFNNRGFRSRQQGEESSFQPGPGRPRRQHGERSYLHRPTQPQSRPLQSRGPQSRGPQSRPPLSRFGTPAHENYPNRSDRGFGTHPAKPWVAKPDRDQRRSAGNRSGRPLASGPFNRRPPGRPSKPGNEVRSNRRGPGRGPGNRFRKPGR
jgi:23S rRNA pseudouridine2605 synthase